MTVEGRTRQGRIATTLVMLAIFAGMTAMALGFPSKASMVPLLIGVPGTLLCAVQLVLDLRRGPEAAAEPPKPESAGPPPGREAFMLLWLAAFTLGLLAFGFLGAGPILVFLYLWAGERETLGVALFAAAGTFAVLWAGFVWLLELTLFPGLIPPLLF